jgi:hypothetical protein
MVERDMKANCLSKFIGGISIKVCRPFKRYGEYIPYFSAFKNR